MSTIGVLGDLGESSQGSVTSVLPESYPVRVSRDDDSAEGNVVDSTQQTTGETIIDGKKLDEILGMFQSQLDFQQRQLDLLRGLKKPEEAPARRQTDIRDACERAVSWMDERSPSGDHLKEIAEASIKRCQDREVLWFSKAGPLAENEDFVSTYRKPQKQNDLSSKPPPLDQLLLDSWPASLGTLSVTPGDDPEFNWKKRLGILWWDVFKGDGYNMPYMRLNVDEQDAMEWIHGRNEIGKDGEASSSDVGFGQVMGRLVVWLDSLLLDSFVSGWASKRETIADFVTGRLVATHAIRYFKYISDRQNEIRINEVLAFGDLPTIRETGKFYRANEAEAPCLEERRVSLALVVDDSTAFPCFTMIALTDEDFHPPVKKIIILDRQFSPVLKFIHLIDDTVQHACDYWGNVLKGLDVELSVKFTDLFDDFASEQLMFDGKSFLRSKTYFQMQQLCRIFNTTIEETIRDLKENQARVLHRVRDWFRWDEGFDSDFEALSTEWDKHTADQIAKLNVVIDMIRKKGEEVLFNASSVREASKSSELAKISVRQNRYIFVFTVTTVIYLPLGFVTSIFGMHLFDTTDPEVVASRRKFYITIVVLSVATYMAAFVAYWLVRSDNDDTTAKTSTEEEGQNKEVVLEGEEGSWASGICNLRGSENLSFFKRLKGRSEKKGVSNKSAV